MQAKDNKCLQNAHNVCNSAEKEKTAKKKENLCCFF